MMRLEKVEVLCGKITLYFVGYVSEGPYVGNLFANGPLMKLANADRDPK
jgi:hypothetical protein